MGNIDIRKARKHRGYTQEELAKELGINRATLSKYESGVIEPSVAQLKRIAEILGVHFSALLSEDVMQEYFDRNLDLVAVDIQQNLIDDAVLNDDFDAYKKALETHPEEIEEQLIDQIIKRKSQHRLLAAFSKLNSEGQLRIIEYAEALVVAGKYADSSNQ